MNPPINPKIGKIITQNNRSFNVNPVLKIKIAPINDNIEYNKLLYKPIVALFVLDRYVALNPPKTNINITKM